MIGDMYRVVRLKQEWARQRFKLPAQTAHRNFLVLITARDSNPFSTANMGLTDAISSTLHVNRLFTV